MTKERRLKHEARESATWRGHKLSPFTKYAGSEGVFRADCKTKGCFAAVYVELCPAPNGIEIGGAAVAMHCPVPENHILNEHFSIRRLT